MSGREGRRLFGIGTQELMVILVIVLVHEFVFQQLRDPDAALKTVCGSWPCTRGRRPFAEVRERTSE